MGYKSPGLVFTERRHRGLATPMKLKVEKFSLPCPKLNDRPFFQNFRDFCPKIERSPNFFEILRFFKKISKFAKFKGYHPSDAIHDLQHSGNGTTQIFRPPRPNMETDIKVEIYLKHEQIYIIPSTVNLGPLLATTIPRHHALGATLPSQNFASKCGSRWLLEFFGNPQNFFTRHCWTTQMEYGPGYEGLGAPLPLQTLALKFGSRDLREIWDKLQTSFTGHC